MTPRLTVITPSYNQAAFVERTLRSVLDQGYPDLEYFVVDGGSTDGSVEIIERYADRLAWWVSEADNGQTDALNKGLRRATGDIVAYINSDDYYLPGAFQTAVQTLADHPEALWMSGAARFVDADGAVTEVWKPVMPAAPARYWLAGTRWAVPQAATFWRRDCFERYGLFREDMHYVFDTEFGIRLAFAGHFPAMIDDELAVRVVHEEAKSWNLEPFEAEGIAMEREYRALLTPTERAMYATKRSLIGMGLHKVAERPAQLVGKVVRR
jgi:glycosyltransferase involved in cell wall biosynthesis